MPETRPFDRPYASTDRHPVMPLAHRPAIGVAPWRDTDAVGAAVTEWVSTSVEQHDAEDHEVLVAVADDEVVGFVTLARRRHVTGETDASIGELVVKPSHERQGTGSLRTDAPEPRR